ncbi:amidase family protein [Microbacterium hominis]|uniref:amidase family protein n=1 Tax=Microbacterium hominis TaxID=162426 RepID=UPI0007687807|nr:amidase family protein [Microbacterium hominis]KXC06238.1 hypothetical protein MhomT_06610 [Microbacterium hominis]
MGDDAFLAPLREALQAHVRDAVLLLPTVPGPAPSRAATGAQVDAVRQNTLRLTTPAAVGGLPALSVPVLTVATDRGDAPVGVSLVSRAGTDIALVRLGRALHARITETESV